MIELKRRIEVRIIDLKNDLLWFRMRYIDMMMMGIKI
jgi:hypothetical protein